MKFVDYLADRRGIQPLSTDDSLGLFLPLLREVIDTHRCGQVAPLEGVEAISVDEGRLWYGDAQQRALRNHISVVERVELSIHDTVEVLSELHRTVDVNEFEQSARSAEIGSRDQVPERPMFLAGYVAWEHLLDHHDPLSDVFCLGLTLASLTCALDLNDPIDVERFVGHRRNLFAINEHLHPAIAQAIMRMTELQRRRRPQDLSSILSSLENYRDQTIAWDVDLARLPGLRSQDVLTRKQALLSLLRNRLFDLSRRNPLLDFRPTLGVVNLTLASVPLVADIRNLSEDRIMVCGPNLLKQLGDGKPVTLNKYLNFSEAIYLPSLLDRIISEARRDQQEFGFAQLRLVLVFLSWANVKIKPAERYFSPLVLLPVALSKRKGVRDAYTLQATGTEAEINPVVRHQFQQLFNITLPEAIDIADGGIESLLDLLKGRIHESEPAVTLQRIDRPRIHLLHDKAKRRLDQYRRRARVTGRGVRSFGDIDYSYDPANYNPLGIKLFSAKVQTPSPHLQHILEAKPKPQVFAQPISSESDSSESGSSKKPVESFEVDRSFFRIENAQEENPFLWNFDLCDVTLANFHYRRMSLVRDYDSILAGDKTNPAFEYTFSLTPRATQLELPAAPPLKERFDVVPCDPTQATAIAEARRGESYIIQGPPGTGKSQTITNLIADFVGQGRRVLFVCEKRAAIDVVFARLRQCDLESICCVVHDSQADKKEFIQKLKQTYNAWIAPIPGSKTQANARDASLQRLTAELQPLIEFESLMVDEPLSCQMSVRSLLDQCLLTRNQLVSLTEVEQERLPTYAAWSSDRARVRTLQPLLTELQPNGVLAEFPLRRLNPELTTLDRPVETIGRLSTKVIALFDALNERQVAAKFGRDHWKNWSAMACFCKYVRQIEGLVRTGNLALLKKSTALGRKLQRRLADLQEMDANASTTRELAKDWHNRLPPDTTAHALAQAQVLEAKLTRWLSPSWWRIYRAVKQGFNFAAHTVQPTIVQALTVLNSEHLAVSEHQRTMLKVLSEFSIDGELTHFLKQLEQTRNDQSNLPTELKELHRRLMALDDPTDEFQELIAIAELAEEIQPILSQLLVDFLECPIGELREAVRFAKERADLLPRALSLLGHLGRLSPELSSAMRELPLNDRQLEAATAHRTWKLLVRQHRLLEQFQGSDQRSTAERLEDLYDDLLRKNAKWIAEQTRQQFLNNFMASQATVGTQSTEVRDRKKEYSVGRRALEHEFSKTMRFRAIRELVEGPARAIIQDLMPVWLMSPLSVSDTLPLHAEMFDVVIFDEASQIPLEEAVPSLFRAAQTIVVGDEMQLPPTTFFASKRSENDEEDDKNDTPIAEAQYELSSDSFLAHASKNLPSTMLGWHYRSRSESLISFSNWAFYDGRLLTVPDEKLPTSEATSAEGYELLQARALSFHYLSHGVYDKRRNRTEAEYIAVLVREVLIRKVGQSIGVIAFSEAQQDEILLALDRLAQDDDEFRELYDAELQREVDGQFVGLLVKNLENIQGDERDVVFLSVCYGPNPAGKMLMNFGPINQNGGEKRLNVAFSRAKERMAVISSIRYDRITNDYNEGARCLKNYVRYAESVSQGDAANAQRVLASVARWRESNANDQDLIGNPLAEQISAAMRDLGYEVDLNIGQSHFRVDLAVRRAGDAKYRLGILLDTASGYDQFEPLERDVLRPRLLRNFGWRMTTVMAKDWLADSASEIKRIEKYLALVGTV